MDRASFLSELSQHDRVLQWQLGGPDDLPATLLPYRLRLNAALSRPYTAWLICVSSCQTLELKHWLGRPAQVSIRHSGGESQLSGLVTATRLLGVDGGLSACALRIEPGLALLAQRRTSRVFQDRSVPDIVQQILDEHLAVNIALSRCLRLVQQLRREHPPRSLCMQYQESDLDFIQRLLAEEGISYLFRSGQDRTRSQHEWVLFDDARERPAASLERLAYRRSHGDQAADALWSWQGERQIVTTRSSLSSYDYKSDQLSQARDSTIIAQGACGDEAGRSLEDYQPLTHYYTSSQHELESCARWRQEAHDLRAKTFYGVGTAVGLELGHWFILEDHPAHAGDEESQRQFLLTALWLDVASQPASALAGSLPGDLASLQLPGEPEGELAALAVEPGRHPALIRFSAVRRGIAVVPAASGELSRPTARGPLTGVVVGEPGDTVTTDALGRIKVQLRFARPQEHPRRGAGFDQHSGTWIRVLASYAGDGFGHQFLPRINDEVVVDFLYGDIDRPYVAGLLYGGRRLPPRFSDVGSLPGNRALSGIQTREHQGEHSNELLFDDTPGQSRVRLASSQAASALNLGWLTHPRRDGQAQARGVGAELRTDAAAAIRAAQGLLLSTYGRDQSRGQQLDREELTRLLDACAELFKALGNYAAEHGGSGLDDSGPQQLRQALAGWPAAADSGAERSGEAVMALAASAGLVSATAGSQLHYAEHNIDSVAQQQLQLSSGQRTSLRAGQGMELFAQSGGLTAMAHQGPLRLQAQTEDLALHAATDIRLTASSGEVMMTAPTIRLVAEDGSFIHIGNGVTIGSRAGFKVQAASHDLLGPATESAARPACSQSGTDQRFQLHYPDASAAMPKPAANQSYRCTLDDGRVVADTTDSEGRSELMQDAVMRLAKVALIDPHKL